MKLKALQEKEIKASLESRLNKNDTGCDQDMDELLENARTLNQLIMDRSKEASLVITNLPPVNSGQNE
jgi:hypothetical protein